MELPDYYAVLDVPPDADKAAIRLAFRRLVLLHHPDAHPDDLAADERFREIVEAHAVLIDPERRARYDALRDSEVDHTRSSKEYMETARWPSFEEWAARFSPPR